MTQQTKRRGISLRAFARLDQCSEALVRRAVRRGCLIPYADGSLDPRLAGTPWRARLPVPIRELSVEVRPRAAGLPYLSYNDALIEKANWQAALAKLEYKAKAAEYVERELVEAVAHNAWCVLRESWQTWPERVAPQIAAQLAIADVGRLREVLSVYVDSLLDELCEPANLLDSS